MSFRILLGFAAAVLVMLAIPVLLAWSGRRRRLRVGRDDGAVVLRMPRGHHAILATIAIVPFAGIAYVALSAEWAAGSESNAWIMGGLMAAIGAIAGGYLLMLEARARIRVDDQGIEKVGALTTRRVAWSDVAKVTFNPVNSWFFLTLAGGGRLYVVDGLEGNGDFAEIALRRLPREVLAGSPDAAEALRDLASS
jgi:hypothetical protein